MGESEPSVPPTKSDDHGGKSIILFDGVCGLCHAFVNFLIRRDKRDQFRFAALQSDFGRGIVARHGGDVDAISTVYLVRNLNTVHESIQTRGKAALYAIDAMGGGWRILGLLRVLPSFLLNLGYSLVARFRYRIWGKLEVCPMPTEANRGRFIS